MKRRTLLGSAAALVAASALPGFAQEEKLKVGFIYVGPVGDGGWSYQHDQGRQAIEAEYGDKIETTFIESVPEGAFSFVGHATRTPLPMFREPLS